MWYDILTLKVIRGHWRTHEVKMRSNLKNAPRDPIFGIYAHIISLTNIGYGPLRSKLKYSPRDFIFGMHYHMISLTNISYDILTSKVIRGHQRSLEVKRRSNFKNTLRDSIFGMHTHIISLNNIGYDILTSKIIRCHQRSVEVKWSQIWKMFQWTQFLAFILTLYPWPILAMKLWPQMS